PESAFRRRTTARSHRARAPDQPSGLPRRRADRQSRPRNERASFRSDARMSQEERSDLGHRHTQPGAREPLRSRVRDARTIKSIMVEKYNEKARRALFFARYEASKLGSRVIESEHILLGVLREGEEIIKEIFSRFNVKPEQIRR